MAKIKFNPQDYLIVASVTFKSHITLDAKLAIDTGASFVMLPWKLTNKLGIKIDPAKTVKTSTASMVETIPEITVPELTWLGQSVKNVPAVVKDLPPETGVAGLLELSFLKHFRLEIDFRKGLLSLE